MNYPKTSEDNKLPKDLRELYRNILAPVDLFKLDENNLVLDSEKVEQYYKIIAKSIFLGQYSRLDL